MQNIKVPPLQNMLFFSVLQTIFRTQLLGIFLFSDKSNVKYYDRTFLFVFIVHYVHRKKKKSVTL